MEMNRITNLLLELVVVDVARVLRHLLTHRSTAERKHRASSESHCWSKEARVVNAARQPLTQKAPSSTHRGSRRAHTRLSVGQGGHPGRHKRDTQKGQQKRAQKGSDNTDLVRERLEKDGRGRDLLLGRIVAVRQAALQRMQRGKMDEC